MRRATERLAARSGTRQIDAVLRADRAADAAERVVRRVWADIIADLKAHRLHGILLRLHHLPVLVRGEIAKQLAGVVSWGHAAARRGVAGEVPRDVLRRLAARRAGGDRLQHAGGIRRDAEAGGGRTPLREAFTFDDIFAPFRGGGNGLLAELLALLFPAPSPERVQHIVYASGWQQRIRSGTGLGSPEAIAARVSTGYALGHDVQQIARAILPEVQGVQSAARRVARTEAMRVAGTVQMDAYRGLGDLVVGYQIHATLDERTRPEHRARDGQIYWARPKSGQKGYGEMPHPPQEADGSMAWNCRCFLTPVLAEPDADEGAASLTPQPAPDQVVYSDWWATADERRRRLAVGTRRYDAVRAAVGGEPEWEHFIDIDSGKLLGLDVIGGETARQRAERLARTRAVIAQRRAHKVEVIGRVFVRG